MSAPVPDLPTFETSTFGGDGSAFHFDMVRLQDRADIPRAFAHRHNYYHLLWMTVADGTHMLDFEHYPVRSNTVFFVSPGQIHAWTSSVAPRGYVLNFSAELFLQLFPRAETASQYPFFDIDGDRPALYLSQAQHDALLPLLHEIECEHGALQEGYLDVVRSYLLILLTHLRRLAPLPKQEDGASPQSYSLTKRFKLLVDRYFLEFDTVQEYASRLNVTERQLNDAIKRAVGTTAGRLIQQRQVLEAKRLLSQTDLGIAEIAYRLRFQDLAYFCRFFKKHTQVTPGDFKKSQSRPLG